MPGEPRPTSSFTETLALSPDGKYLALLNNGYGSQESGLSQSIALMDLTTNELTDFPDARFGNQAHQSLFVGLAFNPAGTRLYASVGSITDPEGKQKGNLGNGIAVYSCNDGKLKPERFIPIAPQPGHGREAKSIPYPAGLAVAMSSEGERLLVANDLSDNALLLDPTLGSVMHSFNLSHHKVAHAVYPYGALTTKDGKRGYVSLWNDSSVVELDLVGGKTLREVKLAAPEVATQSGSHPSAMVLSADEKTLYVALANADEVGVIDTASMTMRTMLSTRIDGQEYAGSYPIGLTLSKEGRRLFVANASTNSVAVFDLAIVGTKTSPSGFIPTEWYPTALATTQDDLWIATGKGTGTRPNPVRGITNNELVSKHAYIASLLHGSLGRVDLKALDEGLVYLTAQVSESNFITNHRNWSVFPAGKPNPIKHVIYILRENRTYDQVLGDLGVGNGDPSLVLYGKDVTPNGHKLALQFGVLDNFYDSGEVSGNGHAWSTAAISSDSTEKTWQIFYRSGERPEDKHGRVANAYPFLQGIADVNEPSTGYLWTNLAHHGRTYRHYGEYIDSLWCNDAEATVLIEETAAWVGDSNNPCRGKVVAHGEALPINVGNPHGGKSPWPWEIPVMAANISTKPELRGHFDAQFPDFNIRYPDQLRADEFLNEFDEFVAARKSGTGTTLPEFVMLRLPNDHTGGTTSGGPRPAASVADNDLAMGRVIDAVSHSPYWDDTAIFIVEDDAQNGGDHVDAHRSTAFVVSKYSPGSPVHPYVEHAFYTTVSLVATMEALLSLPPMNQNDAYAPLLTNLFSGADQPPFTADDSNLQSGLIYQVNPPNAVGGKISAKMDFSHADAADSVQLNAILWRDRRGNAPMPKTVKSVRRQVRREDND